MQMREPKGYTYIEVRRIALDADFDVLGLNLAVEELCGDVGR